MGNSNGEWGDYASDPAAAARWDTYAILPDPPAENKALQGWLEKKGLEYADLLRIGARWGSMGGKPCLVYFFPDGLKYRTLDGHRKTEEGAVFDRFKFVKSSDPDGTCVVAEGETDGALLSRLCHRSDVAILPAGAKHVTPTMVGELQRYDTVYVALDNDDAGNAGAERLPGVRVLPPDGYVDWCEAAGAGAIPEGWSLRSASKGALAVPVYSVREVLAADLGTFADNNWFEDGILPVRGLCVIHGPMKSLKSFVVLELSRALATGTQFAASYEFIRPVSHARVLLVQMEIPPHGFQTRLQGMFDHLPLPQQDPFQDNLLIYGVANNALPRMKATDTNFRDHLLRVGEISEADVILFDPLQRLSGTMNLDKSHEIESLMGTFTALQDRGHTVVFVHHNNKENATGGNPYAASNSQRIGADADSICSMVWNKDAMRPDDNPDGVKERNFVWTLRGGHADTASVRTRPIPGVHYPAVEFGPAITPISTPSASTATSTTAHLPSIK